MMTPLSATQSDKIGVVHGHQASVLRLPKLYSTIASGEYGDEADELCGWLSSSGTTICTSLSISTIGVEQESKPRTFQNTRHCENTLQ